MPRAGSGDAALGWLLVALRIATLLVWTSVLGQVMASVDEPTAAGARHHHPHPPRPP